MLLLLHLVHSSKYTINFGQEVNWNKMRKTGQSMCKNVKVDRDQNAVEVMERAFKSRVLKEQVRHGARKSVQA
jgi:hypothetical protein